LQHCSVSLFRYHVVNLHPVVNLTRSKFNPVQRQAAIAHHSLHNRIQFLPNCLMSSGDEKKRGTSCRRDVSTSSNVTYQRYGHRTCHLLKQVENKLTTVNHSVYPILYFRLNACSLTALVITIRRLFYLSALSYFITN